ncbi:MAG: four helix bundle protein [Bacteroidota bacterium]
MVKKHQDLVVYQRSFESAMQIFEISKSFPKQEMYSLIDQIRRSSRSVAANIAEAFRKRRYPAHFIAKLTDAEMEAAETQVWLEFALKCKYMNLPLVHELNDKYDHIIRQLITMQRQANRWKI